MKNVRLLMTNFAFSSNSWGSIPIPFSTSAAVSVAELATVTWLVLSAQVMISEFSIPVPSPEPVPKIGCALTFFASDFASLSTSQASKSSSDMVFALSEICTSFVTS